MNIIKVLSGVLVVSALLLTVLFVGTLWITGTTGAFLTEADEQLKAANSEPSEATPAIPDDSQ